MDLLIKLATQLDNNEFDQALNYIKEVNKKVLKTNLEEAVFDVYSRLSNCLEDNKVYM